MQIYQMALKALTYGTRESLSMERQEALKLLRTNLSSQNLIRHSLASEAVMIHLARHLGHNEELWGLAGLLHDLDSELVDADPKRHGLETKKILEKEGLDKELVEAISLHNEDLEIGIRTKPLHHALAAAETITGLITAVCLVQPDKSLKSVKPKSVLKRMKDKSFASSVSRETIMECEKLGLSLEDFVNICLEAMCSVSEDLGL